MKISVNYKGTTTTLPNLDAAAAFTDILEADGHSYELWLDDELHRTFHGQTTTITGERIAQERI